MAIIKDFPLFLLWVVVWSQLEQIIYIIFSKSHLLLWIQMKYQHNLFMQKEKKIISQAISLRSNFWCSDRKKKCKKFGIDIKRKEEKGKKFFYNIQDEIEFYSVMSVGRANINSIYLNCTLKTLFACIIKVEENCEFEYCLITYSVDMLMYIILLYICFILKITWKLCRKRLWWQRWIKEICVLKYFQVLEVIERDERTRSKKVNGGKIRK